MKKLTKTQFYKHYKHAYKNAIIKKVSMAYNIYDKEIFTKTTTLSNDIIIEKTYYDNMLKRVTINKVSADSLNSYIIESDYIRKV